jgi:hypothetical protein
VYSLSSTLSSKFESLSYKENVVFSSGFFASFFLNFIFFPLYIPPFFSQQINLYNFPFNSILGILLISMYFFSLLSMIFSQIPPFFYVISSPFITLKWQVVVKPFVGLKVVFSKLSHWEFFPIFCLWYVRRPFFSLIL